MKYKKGDKAVHLMSQLVITIEGWDSGYGYVISYPTVNAAANYSSYFWTDSDFGPLTPLEELL